MTYRPSVGLIKEALKCCNAADKRIGRPHFVKFCRTLFSFGQFSLPACTLHSYRQLIRTGKRYPSTNHEARTCSSYQRVPVIGFGCRSGYHLCRPNTCHRLYRLARVLESTKFLRACKDTIAFLPLRSIQNLLSPFFWGYSADLTG